MTPLYREIIKQGAIKSAKGYTLATPAGPYQVALNITPDGAARIYSASEGIHTTATQEQAAEIVSQWPRTWLLVERLCGEARDRAAH